MTREQEDPNPTQTLRTLAAQLGSVYEQEMVPLAILLTGSAAEGVSDGFSDLDLIVYHDHLPPDSKFAEVRNRAGAVAVRFAPDRDRGSIIEEFRVQGVECQVGHATVVSWEATMATVLDACRPGTIDEKAVMGLLEGVALVGGDVIGRWQAYAAEYPDALARATIMHYLRFFPLWMANEYLGRRDATIFSYQMLVEGSLNVLGVLAGLNHQYFSTFQFKRLHRFASRLQLAPDRLADRLDDLFALDRSQASVALERLVEETVSLVESHMPTIDTEPARRLIGARHRAWAP